MVSVLLKIAVIVFVGVAVCSLASGALGQDVDGTEEVSVTTKGVWLLIHGVKYEAPFSISRNGRHVVVNGVVYEAAVERVSADEAVARGDYRAWQAYKVGASELREYVLGGGGDVETELRIVERRVNSLLAAKGYDEVAIEMLSDSSGIVIRDGSTHTPTMVRFDQPPFRSAEETADRRLDSCIRWLTSGQCVVWGGEYFSTYNTKRAAEVDSAIQSWLSSKSAPADTAGIRLRVVEVGNIKILGAILADALLNK